MKTVSGNLSNSIRDHASQVYVRAARQKGLESFSINVGEVHKALTLRNRVPPVCTALKSAKFLEANGLRLVSESGPPSGLSTTVVYTYEFVDDDKRGGANTRRDAWNRLRGALKDVFAELGGGENYLRNERANFYGPGKDR
jgi:hypothetical protein